MGKIKILIDCILLKDHPSEKVPLLFVDVNLGKDKIERIAIYEGDNAEELANQFAIKHCIIKIYNLLDENIFVIFFRVRRCHERKVEGVTWFINRMLAN